MALSGTSDRPASPLAEQILGALEGSIQPVPTRPLYRAGLLVLAITMVLLPLVYLGLVLLVGWLVWLHATRNLHILNGGGAIQGRLLAYLGPLLAGFATLFFMLKPLFAPRASPPRARHLDPAREPLLFAFVERLCAVVGAPIPREIAVDLQVNASAGLRGGFTSLFSSDLRLTIGLPLAAGMTLRQLTGILAHELGHFSQGAGLRLQYLIRSVSIWFVRVVHERDAWDERLAAAARADGGWPLRLAVTAAQAAIWLTRRILWILMLTGNAISCFMSRQMELDADRFEARVAGSETFAETALQLHRLSFASSQIEDVLERAWSERRLCVDMPGLAAALLARAPPSLLASIDRAVLERRTRAFDSHPSDARRIANARAEAAEGLFRLEAPSAVLFADFGALCREATVDQLRRLLGDDVTSARLVEVAEIIGEEEALDHALQVLNRYFQGALVPSRPLALDGPRPPADPPDALRDLREARAAIALAGPRLAPVALRYEELFDLLLRTARALALRDAGLKVEPRAFALPIGDVRELSDEERRARAELEDAGRQLAELERAVRTRLEAALGLLDAPHVTAALPDAAALRQESATLLTTLRSLTPALVQMPPWRREFSALDALLRGLPGHEQNSNLVGLTLQASHDMQLRLVSVHAGLEAAPYPFDHAFGEVSIARYLAPALPGAEQVEEVLAVAGTIGGRLGTLYYRVLSRLAAIGEQVEAALGMAPLPDPRATRQAESPPGPEGHASG